MRDIAQSQQKELLAIKSVVDAYFNQSITVTDDGTPTSRKKTYDMGGIMGIISNHVYAGLGLDIPKRY